jgi:hypothetical protein
MKFCFQQKINMIIRIGNHFCDIFRVDSRQDRIIVRTADAKYQVQAYGCEHEVKAMICRRMSGQRNKG